MINYSSFARVVIAGLLLITYRLWADDPKAVFLRTLTHGKRIEVVMRNSEKVIGNRGLVRPDGFTLEPDRKGRPSRDVLYADIATVRPKMARTKKIGIGVGIYAVLVVIGAIMGG